MSEKIVNYEDETDLRELIKTLWIYKYLILIFTSFITILSIIYVLQKNPTPIYKGNLYMEIGTIQDKNFQPVIIENASDLAYILNLEFDVNNDVTDKFVTFESYDLNNTEEAFELLNKCKYNVPYIRIRGRKGGSTVAVSILHGILYQMYQREGM